MIDWSHTCIYNKLYTAVNSCANYTTPKWLTALSESDNLNLMIFSFSGIFLLKQFCKRMLRIGP
jgi:hypothetical protein